MTSITSNMRFSLPNQGGSKNHQNDHARILAKASRLLAVFVFVMLSASASASASAVRPEPAWAPVAISGPTNLPPSGSGELFVYAQNIGGGITSGSFEMKDELPQGLALASTPEGCVSALSGGRTTVTCTSSTVLKSGFASTAFVLPVNVTTATEETLTNKVTVSGGGALAPAVYEEPVTISATPAGPGVQAFTANAYNADGTVDAQAGSHPFSGVSAVFANTVRGVGGRLTPAGDPKTIGADLPAGFLGNPTATPRCPEGHECASGYRESQVGIAQTIIDSPAASSGVTGPWPIYSIKAPYGYPAKFTFNAANVLQISVVGSLRSDGDYGVRVESPNTPQLKLVFGVFFTLWGTPEDSAHDNERCTVLNLGFGCGPSTAPDTASLTLPVDCQLEAEEPPFVGVVFDTWLTAGQFEHQTFPAPSATGCDKLHFESDFTFQPSEAASADSPSGFTTNLTVPSTGLTDPEGLTTPEQKKVVVTLPKGVVFNPSAANGLGGCSEAEIGLMGTGFAMPNPIRFNKSPNECPDSSKIGTLELKTPLLDETLDGSLYLAKQGENPFGSLFAVYLVVENPRNGIFIKLPGNTHPDPTTGQITVTFDDLPQLPFESLKLTLEGGSRSPLATPTTCGTFTTTTVSTPWSAPESGPPFESENSFNVENGPSGTPCSASAAARPFSPGLSAGTGSTTAGGFTPFSLSLSRKDGEQELSSLEVSAPPGFVGVLTGIPFCPEAAIKAAEANTGTAELANPSCPAASLLGSLTAGVGVGSTPFYASGKAYLAGPYREAPLSIVFVTPAVAGPFDLGDVVVRAGIYVDKETANITVKTDQIPQILDGVPLQVRSITANIDRPDFGINPTSCEKFRISTIVHGASGATATPSNSFQVGGCSSLGFKPQFSVSTSAQTSRANGASLSVKLTYPKGAQANLAKVKVDLPKQLPSRLTTLQKACPEAVFDQNPAGCPKESIIGSAKAITPILPVPLVGPAYFVSHGGAKFPELILVLQGYGITIDLRGETFISSAGITSSTFNAIPDVAVGSFELNLPEGPYSALAANGDLCSSKLTMPTLFVAQNGAQINQTTPITVTGCAKTKTLTRAQKLKQALKACHKNKNKTKRAKCEKTARKKYGTAKKAKKSRRK